MTLFWVGAIALSIVALVAIFWPWIFKSRQEELDRERLNVMLVKERVDELQRDLAEGILTPEQRSQAEEELKLSLLNEVEGSGKAAVKSIGKSHPLLLGLVIASVVISGWSYWKSNEISSIHDWQRASARLSELGEKIVVKSDENLTQQDIQDFLLGLRTRLATRPDDAVGWLLLGRIFTSVQSIDYAIEAFEKSLAIEPERIGTLVSYGQTLLLTNQEEDLEKAKRLLLKAVSIHPRETDALGLLAIAATRSGDKELARTAWQELSKSLSPDDPLQQMVKGKLAELDIEETQLRVSIAIAPELAGAIPQNAHLIVFARAAESDMKMPAAVVKQPLTELPQVITLSDKNAMLPNLNLSSLEKAQVVVRISQDENVEIQPGDLEGEVTIPLTRSQLNEVSININKELP